MKFASRFKTQMLVPLEICQPPFNNTIEDLIRQRKLLARCNESVKNSVMEVYQVILAPDKIILMEKEIYSKKWNLNKARSAEAIALLDLIKTIKNKSYQIESGEI